MKVVTVSGTLGAGKTTLIRRLIEHFAPQGRRCAVIVNEEGEAGYDEAFVRRHRVPVERLRGG